MDRREAAIDRAIKVADHIQVYLHRSSELKVDLIKDLQEALNEEIKQFTMVRDMNAKDVSATNSTLWDAYFKLRDLRWKKDLTYNGRN